MTHYIGKIRLYVSLKIDRAGHPHLCGHPTQPYISIVLNSYAVVVAQYVSKARVSSWAIAGAVEVSMADRCIR
jgi:hypothetical protein